MDKFRWSDGYSHAVEFSAAEGAFIEPAMNAIKKFHTDTATRDAGNVYFREAQLHIQAYGNWRNLKQDGALVIYSITTQDTPEAIAQAYERLETELMFKQKMIWQRVQTVYSNEGSLQQFIGGFMDDFREIVDDETNDDSN